MSCTTDGRYLVANEQDAARQAELQQQESNEQADARGDSVLQSSFESYVRTLEVDEWRKLIEKRTAHELMPILNIGYARAKSLVHRRMYYESVGLQQYLLTVNGELSVGVMAIRC